MQDPVKHTEWKTEKNSENFKTHIVKPSLFTPWLNVQIGYIVQYIFDSLLLTLTWKMMMKPNCAAIKKKA